jgi:hypothetical protein
MNSHRVFDRLGCLLLFHSLEVWSVGFHAHVGAG